MKLHFMKSLKCIQWLKNQGQNITQQMKKRTYGRDCIADTTLFLLRFDTLATTNVVL